MGCGASSQGGGVQRPLMRRGTCVSELDDQLVAAVRTGAIALLDARWVRELTPGATLLRRQGLEAAQGRALLPPEEGVQLLQLGARCVGAITYAWATRHHPDPTGARLEAVRQFLRSEAGAHTRALFWDYCSLHQPPRDSAQELAHGQALDAMADCYGSLLATAVLRIGWLPKRPPEHDGWVTVAAASAGEPSSKQDPKKLGVDMEGLVKTAMGTFGELKTCELRDDDTCWCVDSPSLLEPLEMNERRYLMRRCVQLPCGCEPPLSCFKACARPASQVCTIRHARRGRRRA